MWYLLVDKNTGKRVNWEEVNGIWCWTYLNDEGKYVPATEVIPKEMFAEEVGYISFNQNAEPIY